MASPLSFAPLLGNEPDAGAAARAMAGGQLSPSDRQALRDVVPAEASNNRAEYEAVVWSIINAAAANGRSVAAEVGSGRYFGYSNPSAGGIANRNNPALTGMVDKVVSNIEAGNSTDPTHGATHFEGASFKTPGWAKGMSEVQIGQTRFFASPGARSAEVSQSKPEIARSYAPVRGSEPDNAGQAARAMAGGSRYVSPVDGTYARNGRSNAWGGDRAGNRLHAGNDLQAPFGSPVVAMMDGRVVYVGFHRGYGATIDVLAADGNIHRYATHDVAKGVLVQRGDTVTQGQPIGQIGREHRAPHLHLEFIPPSSRAFKDAVEGRFGATSWRAGGARTIDPMEVIGASKGMVLQAGEPFSAGRELTAAESENARLAGNPFGAGPRGGVPIPVAKPALSYAPVLSMLDRANPLNAVAAAPKLTGTMTGGVGGGAPMTVKGEFAPPLQLGQPSMGGGGGSGSAMTVRPGAEFLPPKDGEVPALGPVRMEGSAGGGAPMLPSASSMGAVIRGWVESLPGKGAVAEPGQAPQPGQIAKETFDQGRFSIFGHGHNVGRNQYGPNSMPEVQLDRALTHEARQGPALIQAYMPGGALYGRGVSAPQADRTATAPAASRGIDSMPIMLDKVTIGAPPGNIGGRFDDGFAPQQAVSPQPAIANSIAARLADAFKAPTAQSVPPALAAGVQARFADAFAPQLAQAAPAPAEARPWAAAEARQAPAQAMRADTPLGPSFMQAMANAARQSAATEQPQQARAAPAPPVAIEAPRQMVQADRTIPVVNADPEPELGPSMYRAYANMAAAKPGVGLKAPNIYAGKTAVQENIERQIAGTPRMLGAAPTKSDPVNSRVTQAALERALGAKTRDEGKEATTRALQAVVSRFNQQAIQRAQASAPRGPGSAPVRGGSSRANYRAPPEGNRPVSRGAAARGLLGTIGTALGIPALSGASPGSIGNYSPGMAFDASGIPYSTGYSGGAGAFGTGWYMPS